MLLNIKSALILTHQSRFMYKTHKGGIMNFLSYNYGNLPDELLEHVKASSTVSDFLRELGYSILVGLAKLIDLFYDAINTILSLDLYTLVKNKFPDFFNGIPEVVWALFGLAIMVCGIKLAKSRSKDESSKYIDGILTTALLIVAFPFLINAMSDLKTAGVNDVNNLPIGDSAGTIGETILSEIVIDVDASKEEVTYLSSSDKSPYSLNINKGLDNEGFWNREIDTGGGYSSYALSDVTVLTNYFGLSSSDALEWKELSKFSNNFLSDKYKVKTALTEERLKKIKNTRGEDFYNRAKENCEDMNDLFIEFSTEIKNWKKTLSNGDYDTQTASYTTWFLTTAEDIEDMTFQEKVLAYIAALGDPEQFIYAYDYYFLDGMFLMVSTLIALIFAGLKTGKIMYDLIFNQVIAPLVIATDIKNEGRRKYILQNILSTYLVFIIILFIIKLYLVVVLYVITAEFSIAVEIFLILGGMAWVIDGPDSIVKLIGIDAGVKSGEHTLMAATSTIQTASNVASNAITVAKRGTEAVASVGARGVSSAINIGGSVVDGIKGVGDEILDNNSNAKSIGKSVASGLGNIAKTTLSETGKNVKTTAKGLTHIASDKNDYDNQAFYDLKSHFTKKQKSSNETEENDEASEPQSDSSPSDNSNSDEANEASEPK